MIRRIIQIDTEKCNGCGLCASACQEGAIGMVDGKAALLRDDYCDGLGNCLPACPTGAISFVEREAAAYDEEAVLANQRKAAKATAPAHPVHACPGSAAKTLREAAPAVQVHACPGSAARALRETGTATATAAGAREDIPSELRQWPVQIKLVPVTAPYFAGADLLIAADCTAYAYAAFHQEFLRGRIALIGCPKLDSVDYTEKLTQILSENDIRSLTVVRMEVPCCGGIERAALAALKASGKRIPRQVVTVSVDGRILD
ncbi:MAG: 4Fe-4S binding protein [Eubacteriales bacterium]|nr:4Fe-4S binding protein [Eubacteriales bacterium]